MYLTQDQFDLVMKQFLASNLCTCTCNDDDDDDDGGGGGSGGGGGGDDLWFPCDS